MATYKQRLEDAIVAAHNAGDVEGAQTLADELKSWQPKKVDPTEGMSTGQKLLAGVGKGFVDVGRGVGQRLGLVDQPVQRADTDRGQHLFHLHGGGADVAAVGEVVGVIVSGGEGHCATSGMGRTNPFEGICNFLRRKLSGVFENSGRGDQPIRS